MGLSKFCDCCGRTDPRGKVISFSLRREWFHEVPGEERRAHGSLAAGAIDLCRSCWVRIGKPKQRPARRVVPFTIESLFDP